MSDQPSITILYDPEIRILKAVLINGPTDKQTARLLETADIMLKALPDREAALLKEPEL